MKQMKILNNLKSISKAYTEGIYADTPANRKLGRVGMTYAEYAKRVKEEKEKSADKKHYFVKLSDGEEFMLEEGATSQEKAIELAIDYATDMVKYNGYKEFKFDLEENTDNWTDEQIDTEKWDWFSIRAKKHGDKIEISVYNWNTHEYLRNDTLKREQKNLAQQAKREREKFDKEFQEKFGWMDEWLNYKKDNQNENI